MEVPLEGSGASRRLVMRTGILDLLSAWDVGRLVPGRGRSGQRGVRVVAPGTTGAGRGKEASAKELGAGEEAPLILPTPPFLLFASDEE